jgi:hypothetical protein
MCLFASFLVYKHFFCEHGVLVSFYIELEFIVMWLSSH